MHGFKVARPKKDRSQHYRAAPLQSVDAAQFMYAPRPEVERLMLQYALSAWVGTAVDRIAEAGATVALHVRWKSDMTRDLPTHPLLSILGQWGVPNDNQTPFEFWQQHITQYKLAGNVFWYWSSSVGAAQPDSVYLLDPRYVEVVPGSQRTVSHYVYRYGGRTLPLSVEQVTHFKGPHPVSRYYGLPAMEAIRLDLASDRHMNEYNNEFFEDGVSVPAGILVVPSTVSDSDLDRLDSEFNARYSQRRKTGLIRSEAGSTVWLQAGLNQKDMDFNNGRLLSRKVVYERLGLPLGLLSEASTEAHARVAERQFWNSVYLLLQGFASKLTADALPFWNSDRYCAMFDDVRLAYTDWQQMALRLEAVRPDTSVNERRTLILGMPAAEGEDNDHVGISTPALAAPGGGHPDTEEREGQAPDDVQRDDEPALRHVPDQTDFLLAQSVWENVPLESGAAG